MDMQRIAQIYPRLVAHYGEPQLVPDQDPLGGLIATILSQSTSDVNSQRAYRDLRVAFATWEAVRDAPVAEVAGAIHHGGLANSKAARIIAVLHALTAQLPTPDAAATLDARFAAWLSALPVAEGRAALQRLPGVGPKTAACVLLFSLGLPSMPVDSHVYRISQRLALIGPKTTVIQAHAAYDDALPEALVYPLHILFIRHGRALCRAQHPLCRECPLVTLCPWGQAYLTPAAET